VCSRTVRAIQRNPVSKKKNQKKPKKKKKKKERNKERNWAGRFCVLETTVNETC
jgi:hypothetical protein